jgi:hypothetical protein
VLAIFQKNYSGLSGFLRNAQIRPPPVSRRISELKKRLGKDMTPRELSDIVEITSAATDSLDYLSSPSLVSDMEPDVARAIRNSANSTLRSMDEEASLISGLPLGTLLTSTRQHISETSLAASNRARIPADVDGIRAIESALDQGNVKLAIDGWAKLTTEHSPHFQFTKEYIDGNQSLFDDLTIYDTCKYQLSSLAAAQTKVVHAQELLILRGCRASASGKPIATRFLDRIETPVEQGVKSDFGILPSDADLIR